VLAASVSARRDVSGEIRRSREALFAELTLRSVNADAPATNPPLNGGAPTGEYSVVSHCF